MDWLKRSWLRLITHVGALLPLAFLAWGYTQRQLGPNPIAEATRRSGRYALALLLLSLVPTAVRIVTGNKQLLAVRRALGLYAFSYAVLHLLIYAGLDFRFDWRQIGQALAQGRREQIGLATLLLLVPLAVTSTRGWMRRLGRNWQRLHRLVYLAAILDVVHYALVFKELRSTPLIVGAALAVLLIVRLLPRATASPRA